MCGGGLAWKRWKWRNGQPGALAHARNPSTRGARGRRFSESSRSAWSIQCVLGQPGIWREALSPRRERERAHGLESGGWQRSLRREQPGGPEEGGHVAGFRPPELQ